MLSSFWVFVLKFNLSVPIFVSVPPTQEITRLRCQLTKEKQVRGELQEQLNEIKGIQRFDPSKAFKHSMKENVAPKSPFKESEYV